MPLLGRGKALLLQKPRWIVGWFDGSPHKRCSEYGAGAMRFCEQAIILDLDGVITATRHLHVKAWKRAFDRHLAKRPGQRPFDPSADYDEFVDGKPREEGVRSFLASRGIILPAGRADDPPGSETIAGIGAEKNGYYTELLEREGPHVFPDAILALKDWRRDGTPIAVVTSSKNCALVLEKAGLTEYFSARIDGFVGKKLGLGGKPDPDYFLEASRQLGVEPSRATIVEDALAGVEAGRRGGFGRVVGIDRIGGNYADLLRKHGADRVIHRLTDLIVPMARAG